MKWILQENVILSEQFYPKMVEFLERMGIPFETIKAVPFSGEMIPEPTVDGPVVCIGSYSFVENALAKGWKPAAWINGNYDYQVWSWRWWPHVFNSDGKVYKFGEVPFQEKPFFIRPVMDTKEFTGQVMDWGEFESWQKKVIDLKETYTTLDAMTNVVVASAKKIEEEYRFVVVDRKVVTGSLYKVGSTPLQKEVTEDQEELIRFVRDRVMHWCPSPVFVLDVVLAEGKYWVLEMGNFNSAGLYACDVQKIVMAIEDLYRGKD